MSVKTTWWNKSWTVEQLTEKAKGVHSLKEFNVDSLSAGVFVARSDIIKAQLLLSHIKQTLVGSNSGHIGPVSFFSLCFPYNWPRPWTLHAFIYTGIQKKSTLLCSLTATHTRTQAHTDVKVHETSGTEKIPFHEFRYKCEFARTYFLNKFFFCSHTLNQAQHG